MKDKEVILVVRRDRDYWLHGQYTLNPFLMEIVEMWNRSFGFQLIDYRNQLRDIASSLYLQNRFDQILLHSALDCKKWEAPSSIQKSSNTIFIGIDEDDWLHPSLSYELRQVETDKILTLWDFYTTLNPNLQICDRKGSRIRCVQTCSWATTDIQYLSRRNCLSLRPEEHSLLYFLHKPLSVKVENIGSVGYLRTLIKGHPDEKESWISTLYKNVQNHLNIISPCCNLFPRQWVQYQDTLKQLISSYKG